MKIRNGFVSNSSSSSFVLLTTEETHKKIMGALDSEDAAFMKEILYSRSRTTFKGVEMLDFSDCYQTDSLWDIYSDTHAESENVDSDDILTIFENVLKVFNEEEDSYARLGTF